MNTTEAQNETNTKLSTENGLQIKSTTEATKDVAQIKQNCLCCHDLTLFVCAHIYFWKTRFAQETKHLTCNDRIWIFTECHVHLM